MSSSSTNKNSRNRTIQGNGFTFTGSTSQIQHLADILSSMTSINQYALMNITPTGIEIFTESNHICNVQAAIEPTLFNYYNFYSELGQNDDAVKQLRLGVDLSLISEAFSSVASSTVTKARTKNTNSDNVELHETLASSIECFITYAGEGEPLVVEFEDEFMSERIEFVTFYLDIDYPYDMLNLDDAEDHYGLAINHQEIQFEAILKSDILSKMLKDLLQINTSEVYIQASNEMKTLGNRKVVKNSSMSSRAGPIIIDTQLNFISRGPIGLLKLMYPRNKAALEKLEIYDEQMLKGEKKPINSTIISCFNFETLNKIVKAVKFSTKCKMMKDHSGIFLIQLICTNPYMMKYPGTLITFCMLELSDDMRENEHIQEFSRIFDNTALSYIKNYSTDPEIHEVKKIHLEQCRTKKTTLNLSYATFRTVDEDNNARDDLEISHASADNRNTRTSNQKYQKPQNEIEIPLFI